MRFTKKQQKELESVKYFIPNEIKSDLITEEDEVKFLEYTEQGKHKGEGGTSWIGTPRSGFSALNWGNFWRGVHVAMFEEGVLDGSMPYFAMLGGGDYGPPMPRPAMEFMAKTMFKGADKELITNLYDEHVLITN